MIRRDVELLDALPYDLNETLRISTLQDERFAWFWADREALYDAAMKAGLEPYLCWWPPRGELKYMGFASWPSC